MKSGKQRRLEIMAKRRKKQRGVDVFDQYQLMPKHAVKANHNNLIHNCTYGSYPLFYVDKEYECRDCNSHEVWTAKQQRWWYEIAKGNIDSVAVRCRKCRRIIRDKREAQKAHMEEMANTKPHPNEAFFKKRY